MALKRVYGRGEVGRQHFRQELRDTTQRVNTDGLPEELSQPIGVKISKNLDPRRRGVKRR